LAFCDLSGDIDEEGAELSFWVWTIWQYTKPKEEDHARPPLLVVGTKWCSRNLDIAKLEQRLQDLIVKLPGLDMQVIRSDNKACGCQYVFPVENKTRPWGQRLEDVAQKLVAPMKARWHAEAWVGIGPLRQRLEDIAQELVAPKLQASSEAAYVGLQAEPYPVSWHRGHDLLQQLGEGLQGQVGPEKLLESLDNVEGDWLLHYVSAASPSHASTAPSPSSPPDRGGPLLGRATSERRCRTSSSSSSTVLSKSMGFSFIKYKAFCAWPL